MEIPESQKLTGPPAPTWMATQESIDAASQIYREKLPAYMDRSGGHCVLGSFTNGTLVAVEDRSTGVIFRRLGEKQEPGTVIVADWECATNGQPSHVWPHHVKVLRRARFPSVRKMARLGVGLRPEPGLWYEVHSD